MEDKTNRRGTVTPILYTSMWEFNINQRLRTATLLAAWLSAVTINTPQARKGKSKATANIETRGDAMVGGEGQMRGCSPPIADFLTKKLSSPGTIISQVGSNMQKHPKQPNIQHKASQEHKKSNEE